jgi:G3E family GTPase
MLYTVHTRIHTTPKTEEKQHHKKKATSVNKKRDDYSSMHSLRRIGGLATVTERKHRFSNSTSALRFLVAFEKKKKKKKQSSDSYVAMASSSSSRKERDVDQLNMFRNYELRTIAKPKTVTRLPTVLVLGHLGSGKTTLLKHVLTQTQNDLKVVVAVNDYASVNVDAELVKRTMSDGSGGREEVMELTNGCVCCSLNEQFEKDVSNLLRRDQVEAAEYLFVETSGIVNPTDLVMSLDKAFGKFARIRLDCVCCVVDAEVAEKGGPEYEREAWFAQIRASDAVFLNKVDLLDGDERRVDLATKNVREAFGKTSTNGEDTSDDIPVKIIPIERGKINIESVIDARYDIFEPEGKQGTDLSSARKRLVVNDYGESLSALGKLRVNTTEKKLSFNNSSSSGPLQLGRHSRTFKTSYAASGSEDTKDAIDFETLEMIDFVDFQRWIRKANVARAKGMVRFASVSGLWDVSVSGRGRVEVTPVSGVEAKFALPGSRLVVIGNQLNVKDELSAMRALVQDSETVSSEKKRRRREKVQSIIDVMKSDDRFEIDDGENDPLVEVMKEEGIVQFRLVGARNNGWTVETLERTHGVDLNALNTSFAQKYNAMTASEFQNFSSSPAEEKWQPKLLLASANESEARQTHFRQPMVTIKANVLSGGDEADDEGENNFESSFMWWSVRNVATVVLQRYFQHIPKCSCGF